MNLKTAAWLGTLMGDLETVGTVIGGSTILVVGLHEMNHSIGNLPFRPLDVTGLAFITASVLFVLYWFALPKLLMSILGQQQKNGRAPKRGPLRSFRNLGRR